MKENQTAYNEESEAVYYTLSGFVDIEAFKTQLTEFKQIGEGEEEKESAPGGSITYEVFKCFMAENLEDKKIGWKRTEN